MSNVMLDEKALDPERGPFGRTDMYGEYRTLAERLNHCAEGTWCVQSEKKDAVMYVPLKLQESFETQFPKAIIAGGTLYVPTAHSECRQAIAALVLRGAYGIPVRTYNDEWNANITRLAEAWGGKS